MSDYGQGVRNPGGYCDGCENRSGQLARKVRGKNLWLCPECRAKRKAKEPT